MVPGKGDGDEKVARPEPSGAAYVAGAHSDFPARGRRGTGAGLELDTGAWDTFFTRVRLMGRFCFGQNVSGWAVELGISL